MKTQAKKINLLPYLVTAVVAAALSLPSWSHAQSAAEKTPQGGSNVPPAATGAPGKDIPGTQNSSATATSEPRSGDRVTGNATGAENANAGHGKEIGRGDRTMMEEMAFANAAEMAAANVALSKAQSAEVKKFAKKMVDDHTKSTSHLQQFAQSRGVRLPTEPDPQHQSAMIKMKALDGKAFDQAYLEQNVTDHRNTLRQLRRVSKEAENKELRDMAARHLPIIEEHLMMAERLAGIDSKSQPRDMQYGAPPAAR